jgi:cytochrome c-type biogenesis protein CcmI
MIEIAAVLLAIGVLLFTLAVRRSDPPEAASGSPAGYLEEKTRTFHENLRDLQFEHRVGKLSDADYEEARKVLEREFAAVAGEAKKTATAKPPPAPKPAPAPGTVCPTCGASFVQPLKFCGECGAPMTGGAA